MTSSAKPSTGVVAASVVAFVLSAAVVFVAILTGLAIYAAPASQRPPVLAVVVVAVVFEGFLLSIAGFGACVATGLLRLRNWARISAIVWAGIMTGVSAMAALIGIALLFRTGPNAPAGGAILVRAFFLMVYGLSFLIGSWWLILFTRRSIVAEFTNSPLQAPPVLQSTTAAVSDSAEFSPTPIEVRPVRPAPQPFAILRGRAVLGRMVLALFATIAATIAVLIIGRIVVGRSFDFRSPLTIAFVETFFYGFHFILILQLLRRARLSPAVLFGEPIGWTELRRYWMLPLFVVGVSYASYFVFYLPLSYLSPRFVNWFLFRSDIQFIYYTGLGYQVANVFRMLSLVLIAPIVEEFVFRGILLTRWSLKWGAPRGILLSSVIFGALHKEVIGHMFFAFVMAVLYIETKSLFLPILVHAANNAIAWGTVVAGALAGTGTKSTFATFQSQWRWGLILAAIFLPLAVRFIWRHVPKGDWEMPYVSSPFVQEL